MFLILPNYAEKHKVAISNIIRKEKGNYATTACSKTFSVMLKYQAIKITGYIIYGYFFFAKTENPSRKS